MTLSLTNGTAQAGCNAMADRLDDGAGAGFFRVYDGSVPTDADTALSGNNVLAEVTANDPAWDAAADGGGNAVKTLQGTPKVDNDINQTGTATFFRAFDSDSNVKWQGTVDTASADMIVDSTAFQAGATFSLNTMTFTQPE